MEGVNSGLGEFDLAGVLARELAAALMEPVGEVEEFGALFQSSGGVVERMERRWVVQGLLPEGYLALLGATSKAGKTCFATALAVAVATGEPFLGLETTPGAVLWCAFEETEEERTEVLRHWPEVPENLYTTHDCPMIDEPKGLRALEYWVRKTDAKLVVIDPLYGATSAESLVDGRMARRALSGVKELCRRTKVAVLVLHHITKDTSAGMTRERFADSNQLLATASMDLLMDAKDEPGGGRIIRIQSRGRGAFANRKWVVRSNGVRNYYLVDEQAPTSALEETILRAVRDAPEPVAADEVAKTLGLSLQSVRNQLTRLLAEGKVKAEGKRDRATLYVLPWESQP